jgi:2-amino-4-hydroxy-6-hydroxymethyldihydropteridine diphosphokinase
MMKAFYKLAIGLGANLGDRAAQLAAAREALRQQVGEIVGESSIYQTAPWGDSQDEAQQDYLNQVVVLSTGLTPEEALQKCLSIEIALGRDRSAEKNMDAKNKGYAPRTIDIDLLLREDYIIDSGDLCLPHPRLHLRQFVLQPLAEIVPTAKHPIFKTTVAELLLQCKDDTEVQKYASGK